MKQFLVLLTLLFVLNTYAQDVEQVRLHVLDNGLRVLTVENHSTPLVSAVWSAHVGDSAEPPDFAGNSHYLEHLLLFRGTEKYPKNQIGEWSASRGGYFNGYTWYDYTAFVLVAAPADLDAALDRHEEMMFHGAFSGEDFETEKKAVFEELRSGLDTPYGYIWRAGAYHMYPEETFYSRSTIGTIETVQAATVESVREYYTDYYIPNNMTLAIVGDFDTEDLIESLQKRFEKYPAAQIPETLYEPVAMKPGITLITEERNLGKAYFLLAVEGPQALAPEYFPYVLLVEYLTGGKTSLFQSQLVIERELLDDISMGSFPRRYAKGWQGLSAETEPGEVAEAVDVLWQLVAEVIRTGVSEEELQFARQRLLKEHWQQLDDQYQVAESLAIADAHGDYRLFADYEQRLNEVTAADVQAVAEKYLTADNFFLMSVFPPGEIPQDFEATVRANAEKLGELAGSVSSILLPSGVTLIYEPRQGAPMESYTVAVRAGERFGDLAGTAEAVAYMMARETASYSRTELQNYLDQMGFTLGVNTTSDAAFITLQAPAGSSEEAMALLVEVLSNPAFSSAEWEITRQEMIASWQSSQDRPQSVAGDLLMKTAFAGTEYGRSVSEQIDALPQIDVSELRAFWSRYYTPESLAIAYYGSASAGQLEAGFAPLVKLAGEAPAIEQLVFSPINGQVHNPLAMEGKTQVNLYMAWYAPEITSDDWVLWQLAEKAIGGDLAGRLWKLRQDEGLAYSVWMQSAERADQPLAFVYMATAGEKREAALAAIEREISALQAGLTAEELDRVKISYLANLNRLDRTAASRTQRQAGWWINGLGANRREQLSALVASASLEEVNRVILEVLDPANYIFVEAGAVGE